jgi:small subunit ribosomal protein S7e
MSTLENSNEALKGLKKLTFFSASEVELDGGRKAIVIFVPVPLLSEYRKLQKTLVEELEKKFGGSTVLVVAKRTMVSANTWQRSEKFTGVRPRSRTLRNIQEAVLDDLVFPTEIVGKRTRVKVDGSRLLKVLFSPKDAVSVEGKTEVFRGVYKFLTNKDVSFELAH